jgi:transposase
MLQQYEQKPLSKFEGIYDIVVPKNHVLRKFADMVDFSFIMDELVDKYCLDNGRNAVSPIILFKYLILKVMYTLSDRDVVEHSMTDMAFKYFLGLRPEDDVISPSLLTKFRKQRLKDTNLLDMLIGKSLSIAKENGIKLSNVIIVDSTHTNSRYVARSIGTQLYKLSDELLKTAKQFAEPAVAKKWPKHEKLHTKKDHQYTKEECKAYLDDAFEFSKQTIEAIENNEKVMFYPPVREKLNYLKENVEDDGSKLTLSKDPDARIGHKTEDTSFYGYKTHIAMTDDRIITAAVITSGEKSDGMELEELVEKTRENGVEVKKVIGDTAYSGKANLALAKAEGHEEDGFELVAPLNPVISNTDREEGVDGFTFNKDAGMFVCPEGHMAYRKKIKKRNYKDDSPGKNPAMVYYFDVENCKHCPRREGCYQEGAKSRSYSVSIKSGLHKEQQEFQKSQEFKDATKKRYKIEAKNGELKTRYRYDKTFFDGISGMTIQGAITLFVANIKREMALKGKK